MSTDEQENQLTAGTEPLFVDDDLRQFQSEYDSERPLVHRFPSQYEMEVLTDYRMVDFDGYKSQMAKKITAADIVTLFVDDELRLLEAEYDSERPLVRRFPSHYEMAVLTDYRMLDVDGYKSELANKATAADSNPLFEAEYDSEQPSLVVRVPSSYLLDVLAGS